MLSSPEEIVRAYTSEVHALYHQVADRAVIKVEILPIEFLHELTTRMGGQIELLVIRRGAEIVAFSWCMEAESTYYTMCAGLDYRLNAQFDLYFNLLYALLDRGLQKRASTIVFGIGSDIVKRRIGCDSSTCTSSQGTGLVDVVRRPLRRQAAVRTQGCRSSVQHLQGIAAMSVRVRRRS